jgi:hypothetical protein
MFPFARPTGFWQMTLNWNAQFLRLTLFLGAPIDGSGLWQSVVGEVPVLDEHRPREGVRQQSGQVGDAVLQMTLTSDRLDWILAPAPSQEPSIFHIGEVHAATDQFDTQLSPWLANRPDLSVPRLAFGLIAISPVPDRPTAYRRLQELVPSVRYDAVSTREVVYQANRPVTSLTLPATQMNRIT